VEFDIADPVAEEAVALFRPDLVIAPFLKRAIPESIWRRQVCLIVHPGIRGDRGPSALDWAIRRGEAHWGVTVLQANAEMDAGDIWASAEFPMRLAKKSSLYRNEVTRAAVSAVLTALERFAAGNFVPQPLAALDPAVRGCFNPLMTQADRAIDWAQDDTLSVLRKIHAADGVPGVRAEVLGVPCYLFDASAADGLSGAPGEVIARSEGAICLAARDGAVWVGHLREQRADGLGLKLPAVQVLGERLAGIPESSGREDIHFELRKGVGWLSFDFYNGAMSTAQCQRLREAFEQACRSEARVIVLLGGEDFWSNGIHLNTIEAADSPADESWRNINAMNDLARAIICSERQLTLAVLRGNAGAGGVFLSLAADRVLAREGVVLNPHYKGMGNLYGSEYWTYLLPRRVGDAQAHALTQNRLPVLAEDAVSLGLIDGCLPADPAALHEAVAREAEALAASPDFAARLAEKQRRRAADEAEKPLDAWRAEEMAHMKLNFYGFDPSYHVARYHFVHKLAKAWTPLYLARHRRLVKEDA
jgi:putative two-component system hydrogenase maturation factor HypX/HoxX